MILKIRFWSKWMKYLQHCFCIYYLTLPFHSFWEELDLEAEGLHTV